MKIMNKKEFILLKAIFNKELHDAILDKDLNKIEIIFKAKYKEEIEDGMVENTNLTIEDVEELNITHLNEIKEDNFDWAL